MTLTTPPADLSALLMEEFKVYLRDREPGMAHNWRKKDAFGDNKFKDIIEVSSTGSTRRRQASTYEWGEVIRPDPIIIN